MSAHLVNDRRRVSLAEPRAGVPALFDHAGRELTRMDAQIPSPVFPEAGYGNSWSYYDSLYDNGNRAARPFFATDSRVTLTRWHRERAMSLARWAVINVPFAKGAVELMGRLTVGTGFSPKTHNPDAGVAKLADEYYLDKASRLGFMHDESMSELLLHVCHNADVDGDLGFAMTADESNDAKLQLIEAHRIKNGDKDDVNLRDGVWVDRYGRRVAYNVILPEEQGSRRIEAKDFIYLSERNRPDELRSMTALIHALAPIEDIYEYLGFVMGTAKKNSEIALAIETGNVGNWPGGPIFQQPVVEAQPADNTVTPPRPAQSRRVITREMIYGGGGKTLILNPGEKLYSHEPKNPGPDFDQLPVFFIRGMAVGYGVPFEVLWNPESIGGANTRLITALLRARLAQRRAALIFPLLRRVRFWILSKGVKKGDLPYADYTRCDWLANFIDITVDAGRERRERRQDVLNGLDSYTGFYRDNGQSYLEQLAVRGADLRAQCQLAGELVKEFPMLSFGEALARVALLTPQASEVQQRVVEASDKILSEEKK